MVLLKSSGEEFTMFLNLYDDDLRCCCRYPAMELGCFRVGAASDLDKMRSPTLGCFGLRCVGAAKYKFGSN